MKKREEKQKRSKDCLSVFTPFFANKICRTGENRVQDPIEKEGWRCRDKKTRDRRKHKTERKGMKPRAELGILFVLGY